MPPAPLRNAHPAAYVIGEILPPMDLVRTNTNRPHADIVKCPTHQDRVDDHACSDALADTPGKHPRSVANVARRVVAKPG